MKLQRIVISLLLGLSVGLTISATSQTYPGGKTLAHASTIKRAYVTQRIRVYHWIWGSCFANSHLGKSIVLHPGQIIHISVFYHMGKDGYMLTAKRYGSKVYYARTNSNNWYHLGIQKKAPKPKVYRSAYRTSPYSSVPSLQFITAYTRDGITTNLTGHENLSPQGNNFTIQGEHCVQAMTVGNSIIVKYDGLEGYYTPKYSQYPMVTPFNTSYNDYYDKYDSTHSPDSADAVVPPDFKLKNNLTWDQMFGSKILARFHYKIAYKGWIKEN